MEALGDRIVPTATVSLAAFGDATEGGPAATIQATRTETVGELTVGFTTSGTAQPMFDVMYFSPFYFADGQATATITFTAYDDSISEPTETFTATINQPEQGSEYIVGSPAPATINVLDNDPPPAPVIGTGTGLFGRYYIGKTFDEVRATRIEAVNFTQWGLGAPVAGVGTDEFSVRWTGKVQASYTGAHTFYTDTDDGVRLWVNGVLLIDKWQNQGPPNTLHTAIATIDMVVGTKYDIKMEYYDNTLTASAKLMWSNPFQSVADVIPASQLYSNTSTVGDRVWLDVGGNGRQDMGEAGVVGIKVRLLDAAGVLVVPAATTDANGNYSLVVPAGESYQLKFAKSGAQYVFTQSLVGTPEGDSNADATGMTAMFTTPAAGASNLNLDAGLSALFDLDVNAKGSLSDAVDGAESYLPGYEGGARKVSTPGSFNTDAYTGQRMKLILEGFGTATTNITRVVFAIVVAETTTHAGYASNKTHASIAAAGTDRDYSFKPNVDWNEFTILPGTTEQMDGGLLIAGQMAANRTWVNFYAKDYGGGATVRVTVYHTVGDMEQVLKVIDLAVPRDADNDNIADRWEVLMAERWVAQYGGRGITGAEALLKFVWIDDEEMRDPDGTGPAGTRPLVEQKETGDAHSVLEEYRGYILDGGGLNWAGFDGHAGGHIRLDPARKEILVEVDRAATLNNVPGNGTLDQKLTAILNGASKVFSNGARGAGIYMYYLFDDVALNLTKDNSSATANLRDRFAESRDTASARNTSTPNLATDFVHLLISDDNSGVGGGGLTIDSGPLAERGSLVAVSSALDEAQFRLLPPLVIKEDELLMCVVAHEITHLMFERRNDPFNPSEHTGDMDGNGTDDRDANGDGMIDGNDRACIMHQAYTQKRFELATVTFFTLVQQELKVKSNQAFVLSYD